MSEQVAKPAENPDPPASSSPIPELADAGSISTEYRFAIVMYGGVSLAVYMNGISQELLSLVRSTAESDEIETEADKARRLSGTDGIYRRLAGLLSAEKDKHVRFVIDIISGTSAGGINGVFLAKALIARKDMESLKQTWIEEADFSKLLNDDRKPLPGLPVQDPPRSLLNGERMYIKLFEALAKMDDAKPGKPYVDDMSLWVTTTDLIGRLTPLRLSDRTVWEREYRTVFNFVYTSGLIPEKPEHNDFVSKNTPFLAFAARCTSSFPIAFEPMQLASVPRLLRFSPVFRKFRDYDQGIDTWNGFFPGKEDPQISNGNRFFADGGYLDNHPFDHAIEALNRQPSQVRTVRKLIYIEPSPEHPELDHLGVDKDSKAVQPDAIENAWDGLAGIPGKQPIQDSLVQIQRRNRTIRKVNEVILEISGTVVEQSEIYKARAGTPEGSRKAVEDASKDRVGFRAYTALNVYAVTDDLALRIARLSGIEDNSDFVYAIRCLIKVWRKDIYKKDVYKDDEDRKAQFLLDFDISYRMRRYQFVKNQLQALSCLDESAIRRFRKLKELKGRRELEELKDLTIPQTEEEKDAFRREIKLVREVFDKSFQKIRTVSLEAQKGGYGLDVAVKALGIGQKELRKILDGDVSEKYSGSISPVLCDDTSADMEQRARGVLQQIRSTPAAPEGTPGNIATAVPTPSGATGEPPIPDPFERLADAITEAYRSPIDEARENVSTSLNRLRQEGKEKQLPQRENVILLAELYFYGFQEFDAAIFPITYGTDVGELDPVEVIRISPEDATTIVKEVDEDGRPTGHHKLAGTAFGSFGAFLETAWRRNDILWGRLDGAERIITALAGRGQEAMDLLQQAQDVIIDEELKPAAREQMCRVVIDSLLRTSPDPISRQKKEEVLKIIADCIAEENDLPDVDHKLLLVMRTVLTPAQIRSCLGSYEESRTPNRETMLRNISRSSRVIGKMLQGMADRRTMLKKPGAILAQAGGVFWILIEAAVPQTLFSAFAKYWFGLVLLFGVVMAAAGAFFSPQLATLGLEIVAITLVLQVTVAVLRSYLRAGRWKGLLGIIVAIPIAITLLLGARDVYRYSSQIQKTGLQSLIKKK